MERTAVFIDGPNTYSSIKSLGFDMDYAKLLDWLEREFDPLFRVTYYTTINEDESVHQDIRKLLDFLEYNGYSVVQKPVRIYDNDDRRRQRGDLAVDITVDIMNAVPHVNHIVLFSGDSNFKKPLQHAQANGCRVSVVSTNEVSPRVVADDLRRCADEFVEMSDIKSEVQRVQVTAPALVKR